MLSLHSGRIQAVLKVKKTTTACCEMGPVAVFLQTTTHTKEYCSDYAESQSSPIKKKVLSFLGYSHRGVICRKAGSTGVLVIAYLSLPHHNTATENTANNNFKKPNPLLFLKVLSSCTAGTTKLTLAAI